MYKNVGEYQKQYNMSSHLKIVHFDINFYTT